MEQRINIAEILKDCPKGTELYSPLCGDCKLYDVNDYTIRIETYNKDTLISLYHDGRYCSNGEIMLFPSKGKTTWEGFVLPCEFKDGDIVATNSGCFIGIIEVKNNIQVGTYCAIDYRDYFRVNPDYVFDRFATEEEKKKLFDVIKANSYKWNEETKTLEKLIEPNFKVGDIIQDNGYEVEITKVNTEDELYEYKSINTKAIGSIVFSKQDYWELVLNKFDINTLVPFESRVLVRDNVDEVWLPCFFGGICNNDNNYLYRTVGGERWKCCIPYEGNEHLLNKTDDCDIFYKNW